MNVNYKNCVKYSIIKTSYNSNKSSWKEDQEFAFARMIVEGLGNSTFFPQRARYAGSDRYCCDSKEDAMRSLLDIRAEEKLEKSRERIGYSAYKTKIWVHQVLTHYGNRPVYLPSVGEIKKGLEFIKQCVSSKSADEDTIDWYGANKDKSATQVLDNLIEKYIKRF